MAGLAILKHMHDLSDEVLCERWVENPYYQLFCGEEFFCHQLPFDRSSLTRWRQRMGEDKLVALIQESLAVALGWEPPSPRTFGRWSSTRPCRRRRCLPDGRQADASRTRAPGAPRPSEGLPAPIVRAGRQDRADQAPALCPRQAVQAGHPSPAEPPHDARPHHPRHHPQDRRPTGTRGRVRAAALACSPGQGSAPAPAWPELYSLHAPEVECIGKGKAHKPYEFGVKVSVATPLTAAGAASLSPT